MNKKRVIILTGAAGGIGSAMALRFAREGYALALVDIDQRGIAELTKALDQLQAEFLFLEGDLSNPDFLRAIIDQTVQQWGRIDVLINNAAWRTRETLRTISLTDWEKTIQVCLTAPAFLTRYAAEVMEENASAGVIINISSIQSALAGGGSPAYTACKGAIESLTYESAVLYGPKGIRVVAINPGNITTTLSEDFTDAETNNISQVFNDDVNGNTPLQRAGNPEEIAGVAYWLSTKDASFITGTTILADGGFSHNFNAYSLKQLQFPTQF